MRIDSMDHNETIQYILVDFWDTIIHRKKDTELIKRSICRKIKESFRVPLTVDQLYNMRKQIEHRLSKKKEYNYTDLCYFLYTSINNNGKVIEDDIKVFSEKMIDWEMEAEISNSFIDFDNIKLIKNYQKEIYIVSDFYFGDKYIRRILEYYKLDSMFSGIYVSCDYNLSKHNKDLYYYVLKDLCVRPEEVIMIGDNYLSDYKYPQEIGIKTVYKRYKPNCMKYDEQKLKKDILKKSREVCLKRAPLSSYAFELYYFIDKLWNHLHTSGVNNVIFLSREGEILKILFDYFQKDKEKINTYYLFISRKSSFLASFKELGQEDFSVIFSQFNRITCRQFFSIIGLEDEMIEHNLDDLMTDSIIGNPQKFIALLKTNKEFQELFESERIKRKQILKKYILQFDLPIQKEGISIVDVGWKGTMQDNICAILDNNITVNGYYFGIMEPGMFRENSTKKGIVFESIPVSCRDYNLWSENIILYERIMMATHGSCVSYEEKKGFITPILEENVMDIENFRRFSDSRNEIIKLFSEIKDIMDKYYIDSEDVYDIFLHCRINSLYLVSKDTMKLQRYLEKNIYENTGGTVFNYEKKTCVGYLKKILKEIRNGDDLFKCLIVDILSYFCKIKGFISTAAFFNRLYCHLYIIKRGLI